MPVCTQSCFCTVKNGYDRNKEEAFVRSMLAQPGVVRVLGAKAEQDATKLLLLIEWETYEAHQSFMVSPAFVSIFRDIANILDARIEIQHYDFPIRLSRLITPENPILERLSFFTEEPIEELQQACDGMRRRLKKLGVPATWAQARGNPQRVAFMVAWKSVEAHMAHDGLEKSAPALKALRRVVWPGSSLLHFRLARLKGTRLVTC